MKISLVLDFWADGDSSEMYQKEALQELLDSLDSAGVFCRVLNMYVIPKG